MLSAISGKGEWTIAVFGVSLAWRIRVLCRSDGAIISSTGFRIAQGGRFLKGVLRGGVASEASWTAGTLKGSAFGVLDSSDGGSRLAERDPRLSVLTSSAAIIGSSADEFCNGDSEGRSWLVGGVEAAYQRGMELASQGVEPVSEPGYLDNILLVGSEINFLLLLQASQDLLDGRKTVIVGIRDFFVF